MRLAGVAGSDASGIRQRFPAVWIEGLSAAEVIAIAGGCGPGAAGDDRAAAGCGAGFDLRAMGSDLVGRRRGRSGWRCIARRMGWECGPRRTMVFGAGETLEQRVDFLEAVRRLQEETGGFAAFVPVAADAPGGRELDGVTAVERLKTLAIARMFLDNIENVQAIGAAQGLKVLQMGLRFGGERCGAGGRRRAAAAKRMCGGLFAMRDSGRRSGMRLTGR